MATSELAFRLQDVEDLGFTIYADDVTSGPQTCRWRLSRPPCKKALDITLAFMHEAGMNLSVGKTDYMISNRRGRNKDIDTKLDYHYTGPLLQHRNIKILGLTIEKDGGARGWFKGIKAHWKHRLHIIKCTTGKTLGETEGLVRKLIRSLLVSKAVYGPTIILYPRKNSKNSK